MATDPILPREYPYRPRRIRTPLLLTLGFGFGAVIFGANFLGPPRAQQVIVRPIGEKYDVPEEVTSGMDLCAFAACATVALLAGLYTVAARRPGRPLVLTATELLIPQGLFGSAKTTVEYRAIQRVEIDTPVKGVAERGIKVVHTGARTGLDRDVWILENNLPSNAVLDEIYALLKARCRPHE